MSYPRSGSLDRPEKIGNTPCDRCGGRGVFHVWGTCFRCGGSGVDPTYHDWVFPADWTDDEVEAWNTARLERNAKARERAELKRQAERRSTAEQGDAWAAERGLTEDLTVDHYIVKDILGKLRRFGSLSDAQVELVRRIAAEQREYEARQREKEAAMANVDPVAEGRRELTGTVVSHRWDDSVYGATHKMLIELDDHNRLWGTVPAAIDRGDELVGARVRFTATVERSEDDEHFGFYKRPNQAEIEEGEKA